MYYKKFSMLVSETRRYDEVGKLYRIINHREVYTAMKP